MAVSAAPTLIRPQRGALVPFRARKPDRRTEAEELRIELMAMGQEMQLISQRICTLIESGHITVAHQTAVRLGCLGASYANPDPEGDAA